MFIDTHAHLNARQFAEDVDLVIEQARANGVNTMIVVGFDKETITGAVELARKYADIYAVIGWHPVDASECTDVDLLWIEELAADEKVVAIGEIGLDYYWDKSSKACQDSILRKQIRLAKKLDLPIVIHNRDATGDLIKVLKEEEASTVGGVMHCFSGSIETAKQCLDMNFYISIAGPVTFKNAKQLKEVAAYVPMDRLLIETDCPYLTPHPFRGKRNEPAYVRFVAEEIAYIRQVPVAAIAQATTANAKRIFRIS